MVILGRSDPDRGQSIRPMNEGQSWMAGPTAFAEGRLRLSSGT
jgi:hypothetical protein